MVNNFSSKLICLKVSITPWEHSNTRCRSIRGTSDQLYVYIFSCLRVGTVLVEKLAIYVSQKMAKFCLRSCWMTPKLFFTKIEFLITPWEHSNIENNWSSNSDPNVQKISNCAPMWHRLKRKDIYPCSSYH